MVEEKTHNLLVTGSTPVATTNLLMKSWTIEHRRGATALISPIKLDGLRTIITVWHHCF